MAKKITSNKRGFSEILYTSKVEVSSFGTKAGIGKTGVHLQYHNPPEYSTLSKDQKEELHEWQLNNPNIKGSTKGRDNKRPNKNKSIAASVDKQVDKRLSAGINTADSEAHPDAPTEDQAMAYIMSLLKDTKAEMTPDKPILNKVTLKSFLGKVNTSPK